jgi:hypothetical protein
MAFLYKGKSAVAGHYNLSEVDFKILSKKKRNAAFSS